jgi:uncharacterized membrane protein YgcG
MRKLASLFILTLVSVVALPLHAAGRNQSYFTYDDGGTIVKAADDPREIDARVNQPVYPGDEVTTNRRGRSEIRLSDGNVLGLDRSTAIRFRSIFDSYDSDGEQTIVELRYGHVILQRTDTNAQALRLDTDNASYVASDDAIYAIDNDGRGRERVTVFDGSLEIRTPQRTVRLREGEEAHVDDQGVYGAVQQARSSSDDFELWFLRRAERYSSASSRYLDRSLAYSGDALDANGSWIYAPAYGGWCWRPRVANSWRPYYDGYWSGVGGCLTWVSYESWGWVPYHYGRWAYDSAYGWVWLPGPAYAPAWVYWIYGPSYVGWAPMGWYDCYRPYYDWAYRPYARTGFTFGFGFYGRVRVNEMDLRPWTFVDANTIVSTRVDHAAITNDIIRQRLARDGGGFATVSGTPARLTPRELKDPAAAIGNIARRGIGSGTGKEGPGSSADMTPFFRRDPELSTAVRDRIIRTRPSDPVRTAPAGGSSSSAGGTISRGVPATGGGSSAGEGRVNRGDFGSGGFRKGGESPSSGVTPDRGSGRVNRGGESPDRAPAPGSSAPVDRGSGRVNRGGEQPAAPEAGSSGSSSGNVAPASGWRDRVDRPASRPPTGEQPSVQSGSDAGSTVERSAPAPREDWRGRGSVPQPATPSSGDRGRSSDVPRRVIDSIGGARVYRGGGSTDRSSGTRDSSSSSRSSAPPPRVERSSPPPPPPPQVERSSPPPAKSSESSGGEKVHRDHQ